MRHVSYNKSVEFAETPPSLAVDVTDSVAYIRFRRDIRKMESATSDGGTAYKATELVAVCDATPDLTARVRENEEEWYATALLLATGTLSAAARAKRDEMLAECDYRLLPDYPATDTERAAWQAYRQALRDVPEQAAFPLDIAWPEAPQ